MAVSRGKMANRVNATKAQLIKITRENVELKKTLATLKKRKADNYDGLRAQLKELKEKLKNATLELKTRNQELRESEKSRSNRGDIIKGLEMSLEHQKKLRSEARKEWTAKSKFLVELAKKKSGKKEIIKVGPPKT
ncbi:unnamed protein product [Caenorhabditis angaria]|uniref:Uncharacterized protein n=1 Tax=Caenorhabditis angaria TaxID=860376 RepID=A0A9P1IL72_9PELO|nr:unnamed protein product [Caenorhabditis angaria]